MQNFTNLPGINVTLKDGQVRYPGPNTGPGLLIVSPVVAPAVLALPEEPVSISSEAELAANFGGYVYNGVTNPIAVEWHAAKSIGVGNVSLLALTGATPKERFDNLKVKLFSLLRETETSHIAISGMYADEFIADVTEEDGVEGILRKGYVAKGTSVATIGAGITLTVKNQVVTLTAGTPVALTLTAGEYLSVESLVSEINEQLQAATGLDGAFYLDADGKGVLVTDKAVTAVTGDAIKVFSIPASGALTFNERGPILVGSPAKLISDFAVQQSQDSMTTLGFIAAAPLSSITLAEQKAKVDSLVSLDNEFSQYLQVIAGPEVGVIIPGSSQTRWVSGVTHYAALTLGLLPQVATTNQTLPGARALRYNLSLKQLDELTGKKYVTFRNKNNRISIVDGVTTAPDVMTEEGKVKSDYTRLSTVRIVNYTTNRIREALDAFIGNPNEYTMYTAMNTAIKSVIKECIERGIIQDARYTIRLGATLDKAVVEMTILPQFESRTIDVSIGLASPNNF